MTDDELRARIEAGRAAWPGVALDDATFARHLASLAAPSPEKYAADLWLACACAVGAKGAHAAFEKAHRGTIERAVARVGAAVDEVTQAVMVALFVSEPGARPRIAEYAGRAALRTWLATVATNAALNAVQRKDNQAHESLAAVGAAAAAIEPELALAKARHGEALEEALRESLAALADEHRVILRLHHARGWTMDRLATMYRLSRSAAGRLVVDARQRLLDDTKRRLRERLKLTPAEVESLLAVLKSDLQMSLVRALDTED